MSDLFRALIKFYRALFALGDRRLCRHVPRWLCERDLIIVMRRLS